MASVSAYNSIKLKLLINHSVYNTIQENGDSQCVLVINGDNIMIVSSQTLKLNV